MHIPQATSWYELIIYNPASHKRDESAVSNDVDRAIYYLSLQLKYIQSTPHLQVATTAEYRCLNKLTFPLTWLDRKSRNRSNSRIYGSTSPGLVLFSLLGTRTHALKCSACQREATFFSASTQHHLVINHPILVFSPPSKWLVLNLILRNYFEISAVPLCFPAIWKERTPIWIL